jgi:hypothetical protein
LSSFQFGAYSTSSHARKSGRPPIKFWSCQRGAAWQAA